MSYTPFSTQNADYWLAMSAHVSVVNEERFDEDKIKTLDAIVLEDRGYGSKIFSHDSYASVVDAAQRNNISLYTMDINVNPDAKYDEIRKAMAWGGGIIAISCGVAVNILKRKQKLTRRGFLALGCGFMASLGVFGVGYGLQKADESITGSRKEANRFARKFVALETEIFDTEVATLRNAVTARKTEEFLAQMLMQRLGRKPRIALVYGALHAGMRECIEDKDLRDEILADFSGVLSKYRKSPVFERWLNTIYEFVPDGFGFVGNEYNCNCF